MFLLKYAKLFLWFSFLLPTKNIWQYNHNLKQVRRETENCVLKNKICTSYKTEHSIEEELMAAESNNDDHENEETERKGRGWAWRNPGWSQDIGPNGNWPPWGRSLLANVLAMLSYTSFYTTLCTYMYCEHWQYLFGYNITHLRYCMRLGKTSVQV